MAMGRQDTPGDDIGPWEIVASNRVPQLKVSYRGNRCGHFAVKDGSPIYLMRQIMTLTESELGQLMDAYPGRNVVLLTNGKAIEDEGPGEFILPKTKVVKAGTL